MTAATPAAAPDPGEARRGIEDLERWLAQRASAPTSASDRQGDEPHGETRRVRRLRAEVAEAHRLAVLQDDDTPLMIDSRRVRRRRRAAYEAARLHELEQSPIMRAWQAARVRRLLVTASMVSLTLALAWSTAGVQTFAADGADPWSPAWVFAWFVEPFMSLALLVVVGARAYMGTRGQPIESRTLTRIERLFLALTLGMNAWPYLPGVADNFVFSRLVLHLLGPVVACAIVIALPIILAALAGLDHGGSPAPSTAGPTPPTYRANTATTQQRRGVDVLLAEARRLIEAGALPASPSATALQRTLRCGMDAARVVRDALNRG